MVELGDRLRQINTSGLKKGSMRYQGDLLPRLLVSSEEARGHIDIVGEIAFFEIAVPSLDESA